MIGPGRAQLLIAALVALGCALSAVAPARADAASRFHRLGYAGPEQFYSDGVRFAVVEDEAGGPPLVFDTFRGRRFRPKPPVPECRYGDIGGGLALWHCPTPRRALISDLATGRSREPAGIGQLDELSPTNYPCVTNRIGQHWLSFSCGSGGGSSPDGYLKHRTGTVHEAEVSDWASLDLDYDGLVHDRCAPLDANIGVYRPPFALEPQYFEHIFQQTFDELRLGRCGQKRAELLSRCPDSLCVTPQLASRYVTWGEDERVFAYLPRIRRRVLVGRAPAELRGYAGALTVAHTCNRVFAQWSRDLYVARFEPRKGAPPCQTAR